MILYALLCGSLPFDDENIPNLFRKIKGGVYTLPSYLSPGAEDLVQSMLRTDPLERISIEEIRQHQWFAIDLPTSLTLSPQVVIAESREIDEIIIGKKKYFCCS